MKTDAARFPNDRRISEWIHVLYSNIWSDTARIHQFGSFIEIGIVRTKVADSFATIPICLKRTDGVAWLLDARSSLGKYFIASVILAGHTKPDGRAALNGLALDKRIVFCKIEKLATVLRS